jgi:hypothetical protein
MEMSDVVSFHGYDGPAGVVSKSQICRRYNRPVLCTEWLHRQSGNTFETILPIFAQDRIGGYHCGLVNGKTQTHLAWGWRPGRGERRSGNTTSSTATGNPIAPKRSSCFRSTRWRDSPKKEIHECDCSRDGRFRPPAEIALLDKNAWPGRQTTSTQFATKSAASKPNRSDDSSIL